MAKSLRDNLGRRMRAADGSRRLVFGGPEAEKQFAEAQLLQQQMTSGNAMQNLTAAQNNAAQIAQQNIAANMQDEQFRQQLAQDQRQAEDRLALDRQRQQAQQAEALGNLRLRAGNLDIDQQRLRNQATQYANQLRLQERQMDQKDAESGLRQKTEISRMAEGLLQQASGLKLSEEGLAELSKLKAQYRSIQRNRDKMRPAQYNEYMQDWMGKFEQANLAQYEERQLPLSDRAGTGVEVINKGGVTLLATEDADGNISYRELRTEDATPTGQMPATRQAYAQRMLTDPSFADEVQARAVELYNQDNPDQIQATAVPSDLYPQYIERVLDETIARRRAITNMAAPLNPQVGPPRPVQQYSPYQQPEQGFVPSEEDNIPSASDGQQVYPAPSAAQNLDTYGGSEYAYGFGGGGGVARSDSFLGRNTGLPTTWADTWKRFWYGDKKQSGLLYGTENKFKRVLPKGSPAQKLKTTMDTHSKGITDEDMSVVQDAVLGEIAAVRESEQVQQLSQRYEAVRGEPLNLERVFNEQLIVKLMKAGVEDPIGNLLQGVADAIEEGADHVGTFGSKLEHNTLNAPVVPRSVFMELESKDFYEKMPPIWYDEYGIMHRRESKPDPEPQFQSRPQMIPLGY